MKINRFFLCALLAMAIFVSCKSKTEQADTAGQATAQDSLILNDSESVVINTNSTMANDEVLLKFNPVKGTKYNMVIDMNYDIVTSAMGQEMKQNMKMGMNTDMTVSDVNAAGNTSLTAVYTGITMSMEMGGSKMHYESGKPADDEMSKMMGKIFDSFLNVPLTFILDPSAKVTEVKGFEAIQKKIEAQMGSDAGDIGEMNNMQESIQGSFAFLPGKNVKIGDTWQQTMQTSIQQYPMNMQSTYTLTDRKDGVATIAVKSTMSIDNSKVTKEDLTKMGVEGITMSGTSSGTMQVNEFTGWTNSADMNQNIKMEISAEGQKMPMTMKGSVKMKTE